MHEEATSNEESWLQKEQKEERSWLPSTSPPRQSFHSTGKRKEGKQGGGGGKERKKESKQAKQAKRKRKTTTSYSLNTTL